MQLRDVLEHFGICIFFFPLWKERKKKKHSKKKETRKKNTSSMVFKKKKKKRKRNGTSLNGLKPGFIVSCFVFKQSPDAKP